MRYSAGTATGRRGRWPAMANTLAPIASTATTTPTHIADCAGWRAKLWDPTETNGAESESASAPAKSKAAGNPWKVERRRNLVEVNRRAAWSMCALLFGLFGAPIALWLRRGTRLAAIVVALGIVFIVYFPLAKLGDALADVPSVPYWVAPWIATTVLAAMTGGLLFRLCRR